MKNVLGKDCVWHLTWNGKYVEGVHSNEDLDAYLLHNFKDVKITPKNEIIFYSSANPSDITRVKIEEIKAEVKKVSEKITWDTSKEIKDPYNILDIDDTPDADEVSDKTMIKDSLGATKVITTLPINNGGPLITGMTLDDYKKEEAARINKAAKNKESYPLISGKNLIDYLSEAENHPAYTVDQLVEMNVESWPILTEMGTSVHAVFEDIFNNKEPEKHGLKDPIFDSVKEQILQFKRSLEIKYPGCTFYPELKIKSKWESLDQDFQSALRAAGKDSINGVIDLLVVDANGIGHIFDYKVSRKSIAPEGKPIKDYWFDSGNQARELHLWGGPKKMSAGYQVELYRQILISYGITVSDVNIVPVKLDLKYEDSKNPFAVTSLEGVKIPLLKDIIREPANYHGRAQRVANLFQKSSKMTSKDAEKLSEIYDNWFALSTSSQERENRKNEVSYYKERDHFVHKLGSGDFIGKTKSGAQAEYSIKFPGVKRTIYCTKEELDDTLQELIDNESNASANQYTTFADNFLDAKLSDEKGIDDILPEFSNQKFVKQEFQRYMDNGWSVISDEGCHSMGIMIFRKGNKTELILLSNKPLGQRVSLQKGTTLLGSTRLNSQVDSTKILTSQRGNLLLMKGVLYAVTHSDLFKNAPIASIRAVNPWGGQEFTQSNSLLTHNYAELIRFNPSQDTPKCPNNLFMGDIEACLETVKDLVDGFDIIPKDGEDITSIKWIKAKIAEFEHDYKKYIERAAVFENTEYGNARAKLYEALKLAQGYNTLIEEDKGDYISEKGSLKLNGLMVSSSQNSSSANIRQLGAVIDKMARDVREQIHYLGADVQQKFKALYNKYGHGVSVFDSWWKDKSRLELKDPDSADFAGDSISREALRSFLVTLCKLRHPDYNEEQLELAKESDEDYYLVPLLEAKFSRQIKGVGFFKAIKNKFKEKKALIDTFMGEDIDISSYVSDNQEVYNKLKISGETREARLKEYSGAFETHLELVMDAALVAYTRTNISRDYIPLINAFKIGLDRADTLSGERKEDKENAINMENIRKNFDKLIKSKVYGESIIDPNLQGIAKALNLLKSVFTSLTLSLNSKSFFRESLQGVWSGVNRAAVQAYPGINEKNYIKGLSYVVQESHKNFSGVSLLQQMNAIYGMANQSLSQIASQRRLDWLNFKNLSKDTLMIPCSAPDFMHRMGILVAKMMGDGCFEAHSLDTSGNYKYDWKLDKRFEHLVKGETTHKDYLKEKGLYVKMIEEFNNEGFRKKDGSLLSAENMDALPHAYTAKEAQSIKNYADLVYGHYDDESKSLLFETLFGSFCLQYKTFVTAKLEQWFMPAGQYNQCSLKQVYDDNGEELYVHYYEDENEEAHKEILFKTEYDKLSEDEKKQCNLYFEYEGNPMEGMFQNMCNFAKAIFTWDKETFNKLWENPTSRAMLKLALREWGLMALMGVLITFIFGKIEEVDEPLNSVKVQRACRKAGVTSDWLYSVLSGSTSDSQLQNIIGNFSSVKPPMISSIQKMIRSTSKVLVGDASGFWWLTKNIGAISSFQGVAEQIMEKGK